MYFSRIIRTVLPIFLLLCSLDGSPEAQNSQLAEKSRQGKQALEGERFDEAVSIYTDLVRALPGNPGLKINLGLALYMSGRRQEAIPQFERALRLQTNLVDGWVLLGAARLDMGENLAAVQALQKALALQPDHLQCRQMLADALLALERYREAAEHLRELARSNPQHPKAWYGLGRAYEALSQVAFEELEKSTRESPYWMVLVGETLARQGKHSNAFFFLRRALEKSPNLRGVHQAIADIYRVTEHSEWATIEEEKERAIPELDCSTEKPECLFQKKRYLPATELARGQKSAEALYWMSRAYNRLALESFSRLGELPASAELFKLKAGILIDQRRYREAADLLQEALRLSPNDFDAKKQLAETLYQSRDYAAAKALLKELLRGQVDSAELNFLYGDCVLQSQRADEAIPYLEKAVTRNPRLPAAQAALGRAYLQAGKTGEAIPHLKAALKIDDDGSMHYQLSRAYQSLGKMDLARQTLQRYQEIQKSVRSEAKKAEEEVRITPPGP
ncbi:MAG TPA: tetratricopeptide repeat protein [Acidobacteriota bacterium]|jgi:predicted Zn-dependent protease